MTTIRYVGSRHHDGVLIAGTLPRKVTFSPNRHAYLGRAPAPASAILAGAGRYLRSLSARLAKARSDGRAVKELLRMDEHELRDIGLTRAQVSHAVRYGRSWSDQVRLSEMSGS